MCCMFCTHYVNLATMFFNIAQHLKLSCTFDCRCLKFNQPHSCLRKESFLVMSLFLAGELSRANRTLAQIVRTPRTFSAIANGKESRKIVRYFTKREFPVCIYALAILRAALITRFGRRISVMSNAIQTIDNKLTSLIIYCLNCIRSMRRKFDV